MRPHRRQPTRLPRPWDSPGKNIGVGCHFPLQCMKVKSQSEVAQSCPTLRDPMDWSLAGSSVHGIFQARVLEWGAIAFSAVRVNKQLNLKPCKVLKQIYFQEAIQISSKHMKRCSKSLIIREMKTKSAMRYHFTSIRMALIFSKIGK